MKKEKDGIETPSTKTSHKHWVVFAEWCVDYEAGNEIVSVCHSKEEAVVALKERVKTDDRLLAEKYGYKIFEDSDMCFDSGIEGDYVVDHIKVSICEVE